MDAPRQGGCSEVGWMLQDRMDTPGWYGYCGVGWMLWGRMNASGQHGCSGVGGMFQGRMDAWGWNGCSGGTQLPPPRFPALLPPWPALSPQMCSSTSGAAHSQFPGDRGRISACAPHPRAGSGPRCRPGGGLGCPGPRAEPQHGDSMVPDPISHRGWLPQDTTAALFSLLSLLLLI